MINWDPGNFYEIVIANRCLSIKNVILPCQHCLPPTPPPSPESLPSLPARTRWTLTGAPPAFKKAKLDNSNNLDNGRGYGNGEAENDSTDGDEPSSHLGFDQDNHLDHDHDHDVEKHDSAENPISDGVSIISNNNGKNSDVTAKKRSKPWKLYAKPGGAGKGMHDANLYRRYRPDFRELATEYPGEQRSLERWTVPMSWEFFKAFS